MNATQSYEWRPVVESIVRLAIRQDGVAVRANRAIRAAVLAAYPDSTVSGDEISVKNKYDVKLGVIRLV